MKGALGDYALEPLQSSVLSLRLLPPPIPVGKVLLKFLRPSPPASHKIINCPQSSTSSVLKEMNNFSKDHRPQRRTSFENLTPGFSVPPLCFRLLLGNCRIGRMPAPPQCPSPFPHPLHFPMPVFQHLIPKEDRS